VGLEGRGHDGQPPFDGPDTGDERRPNPFRIGIPCEFVHPNVAREPLHRPPDQRYTPKLQEQAKILEISHKVKFLAYISYDKLPILLSEALALVFPTLWEGFGLPVIEAMACGTPVITSNLASLPEITDDSAILIDPYSVDELKDAMEQILTDGTLRSQLCQKGLQRASQFSWQKTADQTKAVLQEFL
jgi:glycosyltransferase involved in cell wall biosynthesis